MAIIAFLQALAILAFLLYSAYRWIEKIRTDNANLTGENAILKADVLNLSSRVNSLDVELHRADARQNAQFSVSKDLIEGYKAVGMNLGFQQVFPEMQKYHEKQVETVKELFQNNILQLTEGERAKVVAENQGMNYRAIQSNYDQLLTKFNRLSAIAEQLEADRDRYKQERDGIAAELRESRKKGVAKDSESGFSGVVKPFTIISDRAKKPGEDGFTTPQRREIPEVYELQGDKSHDLREVFSEKGFSGEVEVIRIADGKRVGAFLTGELVRGSVHVVAGTDLKVVLCALETCYNVRLTQQMTTKCCCREHVNEMNNLKKTGVR